MKNKFSKIRGQASLRLLITGIVVVVLVAMLAPLVFSLVGMVDTQQCLSLLSSQGYILYADPQEVLHAKKIELSESPPITLTGDARSWLEFRLDLDPTKLAVNAKPTIVTRGVAVGYSLPVGGADEELFYQMCVPNRWDGVSDIHVHLHGWLDTAQDEVADAVNLTMEWEHFSIGDVVPDTNNTIFCEMVTGVASQYTVYQFNFTIDYDIDVGDAILDDDELEFRLFRSASNHEIAGEIVICHAGISFRCDKLGNPTA